MIKAKPMPIALNAMIGDGMINDHVLSGSEKEKTTI
jgi:hypothetical protein